MSKRKGFGVIKLFLLLVVLGVLGVLGGVTYLGWQQGDLSDISGREGIAKGQSGIAYVDIKRKITNALNSNAEVSLTEAEINQYIAKNLNFKQGGFMKGFASVKGVYVDLKPDVMEIFIEREIAQYGDDGEVNTDVFQAMNHSVSMKLKVYSSTDKEGQPTVNVEFPGATIGKVPAPGMFVKIVKPSFDQIRDHFEAELDLGFKKMNKIKVTDGVITMDPRPVSN